MKIGNTFQGMNRANTARTPLHKQVEPAALHKKAKPKTETHLVKEKSKPAKSEKTGSQGVVRHLQEGHFKGVADVRLRLNFQTELNAIQQEKETAVLNQAAGELTSTISSSLESVLAEDQLDAEQVSAAKEALAGLESDIAQVVADPADRETSVADLRTAVDTFLGKLDGLVNPPVSDPAIESNTTDIPAAESFDEAVNQIKNSELTTPPAIDSGVEAGSANVEVDSVIAETIELGQTPVELVQATSTVEVESPTGLFDNLVSQIDEVFDSLKTALEDTELPEPTPANGNGGAFEKFLSIYRANQ